MEVGGDALDALGEGAGVGFRLEDAGAGDEKELAAADGDGADVKGVRGGWLSHWTYAGTPLVLAQAA